ncbi:MAG: hypothetical protein KAX20_07520 [Candidatus Omnitrophica bacterium]|nr:hypothetical protein [Candidatus Omnitrophota bacterium]
MDTENKEAKRRKGIRGIMDVLVEHAGDMTELESMDRLRESAPLKWALLEAHNLVRGSGGNNKPKDDEAKSFTTSTFIEELPSGRHVFYVDVGYTHPQDVPSYMEKIKKEIRRGKDTEDLDRDYIIPHRGEILKHFCSSCGNKIDSSGLSDERLNEIRDAIMGREEKEEIGGKE